MLYPFEGGEPLEIPGLDVDDAPLAWSEDGRWLYVRSGGGRFPMKVLRLDLRTGARQPWLSLMPADPVGVLVGNPHYYVNLTPDGRYYAYWYERQLSDLYLAEGLK